jgi:hypothetical protein
LSYFYQSNYSNLDVSNKISAGIYFNLNELGIPSHQIITARELFNADCWLNIIQYCENGYEVFGFATEHGNTHIINNYLTHIETLKNLCSIFQS